MPQKSNNILFRDDNEVPGITPSFMRSHFTDDEGWEIFDHWFDGKGAPVLKRDDRIWSNYMMSSPKLTEELCAYLKDHTDSWVVKKSGTFTLSLGMEANALGGDSLWFLGDDSRSGYGLLHQPAYNQHGAAAFVMNCDADVMVFGDEYRIHYNNQYTWIDYCRPNPALWPDKIMAATIKGGGLILEQRVGQDYTRTIIWHAPVDIKAKFDAKGHPILEHQSGWPFEAVARLILR